MRYKNALKLACIGMFATFLYACNREVEDWSNTDYAYLPLETGKYVEYQVDSITYSKFDIAVDVDTNSYYIREEIGSSDIDNEGNVYYRINRYRREDSTQNWSFQDVWVAQIEGSRGMRVEENMRYVNLGFPTTEGKSWNGLSFIRTDTLFTLSNGESIDVFKDWDEFVIQDADMPLVIGNLSFDETVTVLHVDKTNAIERRYSMEQYAKGIGLINKDMIILNSQCTLATCIGLPWEQKGEKGFILKQRIIAHN